MSKQYRISDKFICIDERLNGLGSVNILKIKDGLITLANWCRLVFENVEIFEGL